MQLSGMWTAALPVLSMAHKMQVACCQLHSMLMLTLMLGTRNAQAIELSFEAAVGKLASADMASDKDMEVRQMHHSPTPAFQQHPLAKPRKAHGKSIVRWNSAALAITRGFNRRSSDSTADAVVSGIANMGKALSSMPAAAMREIVHDQQQHRHDGMPDMVLEIDEQELTDRQQSAGSAAQHKDAPGSVPVKRDLLLKASIRASGKSLSITTSDELPSQAQQQGSSGVANSDISWQAADEDTADRQSCGSLPHHQDEAAEAGRGCLSLSACLSCSAGSCNMRLSGLEAPLLDELSSCCMPACADSQQQQANSSRLSRWLQSVFDLFSCGGWDSCCDQQDAGIDAKHAEDAQTSPEAPAPSPMHMRRSDESKRRWACTALLSVPSIALAQADLTEPIIRPCCTH